MLKRKTVTYAFVAATLLITAAFGAYTISAQTMPTATPVAPAMAAAQPTQAFDPSPMVETMTAMLDRMQAMLAAAPDEAARRQMAPAMMTMLNGMMGLNQTMMGQMQSMPGAEREVTVPQMMKTMTRMTEMVGHMQPMMGQSGPGMISGTAPMTGTMPMTGTESVAPMAGGMEMGRMMTMMGQMMQMMGQMPSMMGSGMMAQSGPGMMGGTAPMTGTMPMTGTQSMAPMAGGMQMGRMMTMMGQMMQMMGQMPSMMGSGMMAHMHGMTGRGMMDHMHGMMEGKGMGHMGATTPMTGTTAVETSPSPGPKMPVASEQSTQSIEGGGVTVKATPRTLTDVTATTLNFEVVLDTHSVELNYDLAQLAVLRDNLGNEYQAVAWTPAQSGGHHVSGLLRFADRATILQSGVTSLELDVTGIAGLPSRIFRWSVAK